MAIIGSERSQSGDEFYVVTDRPRSTDKGQPGALTLVVKITNEQRMAGLPVLKIKSAYVRAFAGHDGLGSRLRDTPNIGYLERGQGLNALMENGLRAQFPSAELAKESSGRRLRGAIDVQEQIGTNYRGPVSDTPLMSRRPNSNFTEPGVELTTGESRLSASGRQTNTSALRRWFSNSKLVTRDVKPLVVSQGAQDRNERDRNNLEDPGCAFCPGGQVTADRWPDPGSEGPAQRGGKECKKVALLLPDLAVQFRQGVSKAGQQHNDVANPSTPARGEDGSHCRSPRAIGSVWYQVGQDCLERLN